MENLQLISTRILDRRQADAERKAAERQRKKAAGLVRIEEWVPAERVEEIRAVAAQMRREMDDE